jgi:hypothetical protein
MLPLPSSEIQTLECVSDNTVPPLIHVRTTDMVVFSAALALPAGAANRGIGDTRFGVIGYALSPGMKSRRLSTQQVAGKSLTPASSTNHVAARQQAHKNVQPCHLVQ